MANYGADSVTITVDDSGGTGRDMSAHITSINGIDVQSITNKTTGFGSAWATSLASGVRMASDIEIEGIRDDTASTGTDAVFGSPASGPSTATRTVSIAFGGRTEAVECILKSHKILTPQEGVQGFRAVLEPTGAVTVS